MCMCFFGIMILVIWILMVNFNVNGVNVLLVFFKYFILIILFKVLKVKVMINVN